MMLSSKPNGEYTTESDGEGNVADVEMMYIASFSKPRAGSLPVHSNLPNQLVNLRANETKGTFNGKSDCVVNKGTIKELTIHREDSDLIGVSEPSTLLSLSERLEEVRLEDKEHTSTELQRAMERYRSITPFLHGGLPLLKVSQKSRKRILLQVDPSEFKIQWKITAKASSSNGISGFQKLLNTASSHNSKVHELPITCIKWVSLQVDATSYREELHISKEFENQWLTICYLDMKKDKLKTLHLITDTEHDFKRLSGIIDTLRRVREALTNNFLHEADNITELRESLLPTPQLEGPIKEVRELLYLEDILKYAKRLNINLDEAFLKDVFDNVMTRVATSSEPKGLSFEGFKEFVSIIKRRDDISHIWEACFPSLSTIDFEKFCTFMIEIQKEEHHEEHLKKLFVRFSKREDRLIWNKESFNAFLLSKYSTIFKNVFNDDYFDHPLNDYFISSSHNTYLIGRQFVGDSSVDGYIRAFQRGCKCVEIDIWDGMSIDGDLDNNDSEGIKGPIVNHGRSFTSSISLKNVLLTVKKYAFSASSWPVILSLEVHCNAENQLKIKKLLKDILGDSLVTDMLDDDCVLPSPRRLRNKILLKVKRTSARTFSVSQDGQSALSTSTTSTSFSEDSGTVQKRDSFSIRRRSELTKILTELSDLASYIQGIKFRNFSLPESKTFNHCISLSEKSFNSLLSDEEKRLSLAKHNRKFLMRVYPSKMRIGSSNFNPITQWNYGVQMVASNWQTYDVGQQINEAMFQSCGGTGYALKPKSLRSPLSKKRKPEPVQRPSMRFSLKIISALLLPKSKRSNAATNPFISVEMHGCSLIQWDGEIQEPNTLIVAANGFNPIWNEQFSCIMAAENDLAFLRIVVNSSLSSAAKEDIVPLGIIVLRVSCIKDGYRYLPINDPLGEELVYSKLLVRIDKDHNIGL